MDNETHANLLEVIDIDQQTSEQTQRQTQRHSFLYDYASYDHIGFTLMFFNVCIPLAFIIIVIWFIIEHSS